MIIDLDIREIGVLNEFVIEYLDGLDEELGNDDLYPTETHIEEAKAEYDYDFWINLNEKLERSLAE